MVRHLDMVVTQVPLLFSLYRSASTASLIEVMTIPFGMTFSLHHQARAVSHRRRTVLGCQYPGTATVPPLVVMTNSIKEILATEAIYLPVPLMENKW